MLNTKLGFWNPKLNLNSKFIKIGPDGKLEDLKPGPIKHLIVINFIFRFLRL